jgi:hypothetical protein
VLGVVPTMAMGPSAVVTSGREFQVIVFSSHVVFEDA